MSTLEKISDEQLILEIIPRVTEATREDSCLQYVKVMRVLRKIIPESDLRLCEIMTSLWKQNLIVLRGTVEHFPNRNSVRRSGRGFEIETIAIEPTVEINFVSDTCTFIVVRSTGELIRWGGSSLDHKECSEIIIQEILVATAT